MGVAMRGAVPVFFLNLVRYGSTLIIGCELGPGDVVTVSCVGGAGGVAQ